ncbi:hypothetical protein D9Q98_006283 [Chlorella vulgaris]|uniref:Structural maintenance of chromosomes protein n=2 Tax=Chlorella vulgaris TaxID=3077 RepID=A0A9D4Z1E4_CHLVU|nr:hypothetical protein D9Q98_006283 [Chlorella vulgaris]
MQQHHENGVCRRVVLRAVELEGFKCYAERVLVGDPFGPFTAICGPNGTGKSVVGEAIAFALGGNARMMRARSLAALVNASPGISAAVVTLHLDILPQQSTSPGPTMPSDSGTEGSAVLNTATPLPPAATAPVGRLLIRRRVNRAGRSDFAVLESAADGARGAEAAGSGDDGQAAAGQLACGEWQAVGPEALRGLLAPLGIQAEAVDRRVAALGRVFVVTQQRQAVQVQDPAALAAFLELLIGTQGLEQEAAAVGREAAAVAAQYDEVEEGLAGLEARRRQLAPEVARWRRYCEEASRHQQRRVQVLAQQARSLHRQEAALQRQAGELEGSVAQHAADQAAAKAAADRVLAARSEATRELREAERLQAQAAEAAAAAHLLAAKLGVQLRAAEAAAAGGDGGRAGKQLAVRLRSAEVEVDRLSGLLVGLARQAGRLQGEEELAQAELLRVKAALGTPDGGAEPAAELCAAEQRVQQVTAQQAALQLQREGAETRVAAAEHAARALSAAMAQQHLQQQQAEQAVEQLQHQAQARQSLLDEAGERARAARQQQYQHQAHAQQVAAALGTAQAQLTQLERQASHPLHPPSDQSGRQTADQAVAALAAAAGTGSFHGRLHSVMRLVPSQAAVAGRAVNLVLAESVGLASCLVVADRAAALAAVAHVHSHRVGLATCKILSELQVAAGQQPGPHQDMEQAGGGAGSSGPALRPLASFVQANPQVPGGAALVVHLLGGWWLAPNLKTALAAVQQDRVPTSTAGRGSRRRRNIVTVQGDVLKGDGEMVAAHAPSPHLRPYLLSTACAPPGGGTAGTTSLPAPGSKEAAEAEEAEARQQVALLQGQEAEARQLAGNAASLADEVAAELAQLQQQQQTGAGQLATAQHRLHQLQGVGLKLARQAQRAEQARSELANARRQQDEAELAFAALRAQLAEAEAQLAAAKAAHLQHMASSTACRTLLDAQTVLEALKRQREDLHVQHTAAEAALAAATRQHRRLQAAQLAVDAAAAQARQLGQQVADAEGQGRRLEEEQQSAAAAAGLHRRQAALLEAEWGAAIKRHQDVTGRLQAQQVALRKLHRERQRRQQQLGEVKAALASAAAAATDGCGEGGRGTPSAGCEVEEGRSEGACSGAGKGAQHVEEEEGEEEKGEEQDLPSRQRLRRGSSGGASREAPASTRSAPSPAAAGDSSKGRAPRTSTAAAAPRSGVKRRQAQPCSDGSSSDEGRPAPAPAASAVRKGAGSNGACATIGGRRPPRAARRTRVRQQSGSEAEAESGGKRQGGGGDPAAGWDEEELEAALQELEVEGRRLQALRDTTNPGAPSEDAAVQSRLEQGEEELDRLAGALGVLQGRQGSLQVERYQRFHAALTSVNGSLTGIYSRLTGGQGDAYCSYANDVLGAFTEGVTFHVRPDRQRWRPFGSLSGGQQALATLALCFALQAAAPSPFYFFDEIDCALDTVNASRVADLIAAQQGSSGGAQFLVVSHKPQVYERAGCLVGVYSGRRASHAVTLHVAAGADEAC